MTTTEFPVDSSGCKPATTLGFYQYAQYSKFWNDWSNIAATMAQELSFQYDGAVNKTRQVFPRTQ
ncbi:MAG: hypothetical protein AAFY11_07145 [Cyanobacteria bacterium J06641_5]